MREGIVRSRKREEIIQSEPRCIYCGNRAETVEHMPPKSMFQTDRPSGMEYAACSLCNNGTSGADNVASLLALFHPDNGTDSWQYEKIVQLTKLLDQNAPGVLNELVRPEKSNTQWLQRPTSGLLQKAVFISADGPLVRSYLSVFGAKLAMALFREHTGIALPLNGAVWCQYCFLAGMTQEKINDLIKIMPLFSMLKQGKKNSQGQFSYCYNCDGKTTLAAEVQFHRSLWFTLFVSSDAKIIDLISSPQCRNIPASKVVHPGELISVLSHEYEHLVPSSPAERAATAKRDGKGIQ